MPVPRQASSLLSLAADVAGCYQALTQVEAVALGGSLGSGIIDADSDIDLYVYVRSEIPVAVRAAVASARSRRAEVDNRFWELGDEWIEADTGVSVDVILRDVPWIEDQLDRVLRRHEASVGYTTCLWHNVLFSRALVDRSGWFQALQQFAAQPYPEPLRRAIVAKNHPLLRQTISSYAHQLEKAIVRGDLVSVNHRVAALLASYFDVLFALNRLPHPGEKRMVEAAATRCPLVPEGLSEQVSALIGAAGQVNRDVLARANALVDGLDRLLQAEGFLPAPASILGREQ
jgi:hypothetical protein